MCSLTLTIYIDKAFYCILLVITEDFSTLVVLNVLLLSTFEHLKKVSVLQHTSIFIHIQVYAYMITELYLLTVNTEHTWKGSLCLRNFT